MKKEIDIKNDLVVYQSDDGVLTFNVNIFDETVWLTQKQMAKLFGKDRKTITEHINNIYTEEECDKNRTCWNFQLVQKEGKRYVKRLVEHYNLDVIISVGYRVKSPRGVQFRKWATNVLKQYMMNGYAVNETRIRQIESAIDELVSSQKILREDVDRIENLLVTLIEKPIVINNNNYNHNQISVEHKELENRILDLLNQIISHIKDDKKTQNRLTKVKSDIVVYDKDVKAKNRVIKFFTDLGDKNSNLHKVITGAGITKSFIVELIKLGKKLKALL